MDKMDNLYDEVIFFLKFYDTESLMDLRDSIEHELGKRNID